MNKILTFLACAALSLTVSTATASERGTKEEAKAMVQKAIAHYKANGIDKTVAEINNKTGKFVDRDLYVVIYDMKMKNLAHINPKMVGKDLLDLVDSDNKPYMKDRLEIAKKGSGWQDYKFLNPVTKEIELKTMYLEKADDFVFGAGAYAAKK